MLPSVINEKNTTLDDRNIASESNKLSLNYNGKEDEMEKLFINENKDDIDATHSFDNIFLSFNETESFAENNLEGSKNTTNTNIINVDYWQTVYSIESKQGKLLYRPRNKSRSCAFTTSPCGHHQLTVQALKDIGCTSIQCRKDRLNFAKSLEMSKKLLALNEKRLKKSGYTKLDDYQRYLIHQQGASGIKTILAATKGEKLLNKSIKKNMANNSPYSYKQLKRMGSKLAAKKFMLHWQQKWEKEKRLVAGISSIQTALNDVEINPLVIPTLSDNEIQLALNYKF